jgi:hypothetical protein
MNKCEKYGFDWKSAAKEALDERHNPVAIEEEQEVERAVETFNKKQLAEMQHANIKDWQLPFISKESTKRLGAMLHCRCGNGDLPGTNPELHDYDDLDNMDHNLICVKCGARFFASGDLCLWPDRETWDEDMCAGGDIEDHEPSFPDEWRDTDDDGDDEYEDVLSFNEQYLG